MEPFSLVTGIFGLTTGVLAVLLNTIEALREKRRAFVECGKRLKDLDLNLTVSREKLKDWQRNWTDRGTPYQEQDYIWIWGHAGWQSLQDRVQCIVHDVSQIEMLLLKGMETLDESSSVLNKTEQKDWETIAHAVFKNRWPENGNPPEYFTAISIATKVAMAAYRSSELIERTNSVRRLVDDLETESTLKAKEVVFTFGQPEKYRTEIVQRYYTEATLLWSALSNAYEQLSSETHLCALLLESTSPDRMWKQEQNGLLEIGLFCEPNTGGKSLLLETTQESFTISASYDFPPNDVSDLGEYLRSMTNIQNSAHLHTPAFLTTTLRHELDTIASSFVQERRRLQKERDLERAETALATAIWVLYAWKTPWIKGLCNCGIWYAMISEGSGGEQRIPIFRNIEHHEVEGCYGSHLGAEPLFQLGKVLAEIAFACPIEILEAEGFLPRFRLTSEDQNFISLSEMMQRLKLSPLRWFRTAIQYCFHHSKIPNGRGPDIGPEHLGGYLEEVIKPLWREFRAIREHRERFNFRQKT